jgi:hypothetical protein
MSSMTTLTRCAARRTTDQTRGYCLLVLGPHTHEKTGCGVHYFKRKTQLFRLSASLIASVIGPSFLVAGGYLFPGVIQGAYTYKYKPPSFFPGAPQLCSVRAFCTSTSSDGDSRLQVPPGEIGNWEISNIWEWERQRAAYAVYCDQVTSDQVNTSVSCACTPRDSANGQRRRQSFGSRLVMSLVSWCPARFFPPRTKVPGG